MATDPFQSAYNYMDQASTNMMPSVQSLDRSAARLRSSIDTQGNADDQTMQDQYARRGTINTGSYDAARQRAQAGRYSAMGTGMASEQQNFDQNVMTGAKNLGDLGSNYGQLGLGQGQLGVQQGQLDVNKGQLGVNKQTADTNRADTLLKNLMDFFTSMGTVGQTSGNSTFNSNFGFLKGAIYNALGLGEGSSGKPSLGV